MKKIIITAIIASFSSIIVAQNSTTTTTSTVTTTNTVTPKPPPEPLPQITNKKGELFLPQAGDWAISFDATPFLTYLGGFLSNAGATAPTAQFLNSNQTITWKYFVNEHTAYRALVRIGFNSYSQSKEINTTNNVDDTLFPIPQVEDQRTINNHFVGVGVGIEKRKGRTRLQGYYGVELMLYFTGSDTSYKYGNAYNITNNPNPGYWNWTSGSPTNSNGTLANLTPNSPRLTENAPGSTFGVEALGFIGIEYFIIPKISIGGEFTWGIGYYYTGQGTETKEEINPNNNADASDTYKTIGNSGFNMDTGLNQAFGSGGGSLNITFHF